MRTSKPISTISYNTIPFLKGKLTELQNAGIISEWYFIHHLREDDETKDHTHVFILPSKLVQTDDLVKAFTEYDPKNPQKPLKCPRWQNSKFSDWYMYGIHDIAYLASKGQARKYHYRLEDVVAWDDDALAEAVREIDLTSLTRLKAMLDAINIGMDFGQFLANGGVPLQQVNAYEKAWALLLANASKRRRVDALRHDAKPDPYEAENLSVSHTTGEAYELQQIDFDSEELPF